MSSVKALLSTVQCWTLTKKGAYIMLIDFINFPKGTTKQGGLTPLKILFTALYCKVNGYYPVINRPVKVQEDLGWYIRKGDGKKSGEPLVRLNFGKWYSSFHAYKRKGKPRHTQTTYVALKDFLIQRLIRKVA